MKFSIRDLLLVTVIVALAAGWWVDHWRLKRDLWQEQSRFLPFRDATLEQILYDHGIEVEFTEPGKCIVTENGKSTVRQFPTGQKH